MKSISDKLASWGGLVTAGIGVALVAVSTLFNQQKAEVESLGAQAKSNIESLEKQRGLIAGEQSIAIVKIGESLAQAFRQTEGLLRSIDQRLQGIAASLGASQGTAPASAYGYSISAETSGAARI